MRGDFQRDGLITSAGSESASLFLFPFSSLGACVLQSNSSSLTALIRRRHRRVLRDLLPPPFLLLLIFSSSHSLSRFFFSLQLAMIEEPMLSRRFSPPPRDRNCPMAPFASHKLIKPARRCADGCQCGVLHLPTVFGNCFGSAVEPWSRRRRPNSIAKVALRLVS